jgi:hypothetical protein
MITKVAQVWATFSVALPTKPVNSATRLTNVKIAKMVTSGTSSTMARASASENPSLTSLMAVSRVSSAYMLGMELLKHGQFRLAPPDEALFKHLIPV